MTTLGQLRSSSSKAMTELWNPQARDVSGRGRGRVLAGRAATEAAAIENFQHALQRGLRTGGTLPVAEAPQLPGTGKENYQQAVVAGGGMQMLCPCGMNPEVLP
jgi:hypothetical protein